MKQYFSRFFLSYLFMLIVPSVALAQDDNALAWPQEIVFDEGVIVIYQPQPEKLEGVNLSARAAVSFEVKGSEEPVFAAIWFEARLSTDHETRIALLREVKITKVRFPVEDPDETKLQKFRNLVETELLLRKLPINMDNLIATLDYVKERSQTAENINNKPPKILFVNEPAVLISLDGAPEIRDDNGIKRVINTPFTIVQDPNDNYWYLNADAEQWYRAKDITGDWTLSSTIPTSISALTPQLEDDEPREANDKVGIAPKIIVATEPTELVSTLGKPEFVPLSGTDLLYVSNTDSDILFDINNQEYYILLSGRWYISKSIQGPWEFTPGDQLPSYFSSIPKDSEVSNVRYAVAGTEEAEDAVTEAQLPQTATVDRSKAKVEVAYDGNPEFEVIEGTSLSYATNTATPVIYYDKHYYAVDDAVWFVSDQATGNWQVATEVPVQIYSIPPESPMYHVTFVHIYGYTPEVVYIGYTQGYTNVYVYHGTVVYGTGYWYPGWYGHYYYPHPATWGFHVRYNPIRGWSFGLSYSNGPFRFTIGRGGWYRGGWWGPRRYTGYRRGYRHGRRAGYRSGYRAGARSTSRNNLYRSQGNKSRIRVSTNTNRQQDRSRNKSNRANNIYADRSGNVHKNSNGSWQQRTNQGWTSNKQDGTTKKSKPSQQQRTQAQSQRLTTTNQTRQQSTRPSTQTRQQSTRQSTQTRQQSTRPSTQTRHQQDLNRSHQSRQRGNQRARQGSGGRRGR